MKRVLLFSLILSCLSTAQAQFVEVAYGASYAQQVYYSFDGDQKTAFDNDSWDLAFSSERDAAIQLNEAAASQQAGLELFFSTTSDFADNIDPNELTVQLYNPDKSWSVGAFNSIKQPGNPFDFGWGAYNPMTNTVDGAAIFALKLRDGSFKKMMIESFIGTVYTIKMADLDGANEETFKVDLLDAPGQRFVYFSFAKNAAVAVPNQFDMLFTRYFSPASDGMGTILDYSVSGVLSGYGVEVAQADDVDVSTVAFTGYEDSLSTDIDQIGFDWKDIDLTTFAWNVEERRAYFVKLKSGTIWRINFVDFEGSSTGNVVFQKTLMGQSTDVENVESAFSTFNVFPNPVEDEATIAFSLKNAAQINLTLTSVSGQRVWNRKTSTNEGFNVVTLPNLNLSAGTYFLNLQTETGEVISKKIFVQ